MGKFGNFKYVSSLSGIFRLLTVIVGAPAMILAWLAYFSSSWTKTFPEILAIIIVEKSGDLPMTRFIKYRIAKVDETTFPGEISPLTSSPSSSEEDFTELDLITDEEEEYLDDILLQTLMYEKFFIGIVSIVFIISALYLVIRVLTKHQPDSTYEIMFDFIYHVLAALGLLTGGALVLLSAAKIQSFVDQVSNSFGNDTVASIIGSNGEVQDKADKIAAAVLGMLNGIFYALCVVTIRMTDPIGCTICKSCCTSRGNKRKRIHRRNQIPVFLVTSSEHSQNAVYEDHLY